MKRAARDHAHRKDVRKQRQHLHAIKSAAELRRIVLGSRGIHQKERRLDQNGDFK